MNLQNIITEIEKVDPEVYDRLDTRRSAMKQFAFAGKVLAAAAIPTALGSMFNKAYGRNSNDIVGVLQFALTLEYLEAEFYNKGLAMNVIAGEDIPAFQVIAKHENAHVALLISTIQALGGTPVPKPTFDFTAGNGSMAGPFTGVFSNYNLYLAVSQTFEDTGVRAYKGQATHLMSNDAVLTAALRIHSVEARHASHVREIRRRRKDNGTDGGLVVGLLQPWITLNQSGIASPAVQPSYNGEELTTQAGINIVGINGFDISAEDASEAFDEPLTKEQVLMIVDPFIV